jgi:hypothetical protein
MTRSQIPFDMFDLERSAAEAKRLQKVGSLYHRGQELAWDGREVLPELIAKHGGIQLGATEREALSKIFGIIMWGELAAWKISLQLADRLVPLEAKMAATSQAHDEARHFYVMYDYLSALGDVPKSMDRTSRRVLDLVLETDDLVKKLLGMQLMVEALALTIFQVVRETRVEPVLADLLRYYEKDEARHVGLGVQFLPQLLMGLTKPQAAALFVFQMQIIGWTMAGLKSLEGSFRALGIEPRRILRLGRAKQTLIFQEMWDALGIRGVPRSRQVVIRTLNGVSQALFPMAGEARTGRLSAFLAGYRAEIDGDLPATSVDPAESPRKVVIPTA